AVFSVACGFSLALGAFVMGSILAGTSYAERIEHVTAPVKDLFGSVFFISVGMMVNPGIIIEYWSPILILSGVVIAGMILFGTSGMLVTGQPLRIAIESGFSLTQIGEFAFIIASLGMSLGVLQPTIYPIVVAVSVITTFTTPYFIRMADPFCNFVEAHLPEKWHFLIDRYSRQASVESETRQLWVSVLQRYTWRVVLYSIVLIAISLISLNIVIPWLIDRWPQWGRLAGCTATLTAMSPFLLALSYPASKRTERERLTRANARFDVPLIVMTLFRLIISLGFVIYVMSAIYSIAVGSTIGLAIFVLGVMFLSKRVRRSLSRIETKFLNNLNERELRRSGKNNNIVSDMHLAYMDVSYGCPFVGERLDASDLRRNYGINVVSIQRGNRFIPVPEGRERIFPGDTIGVIGTDEQIQHLLPVVESKTDGTDDTASQQREVKLTHVQLTATSPLIGKTLASADIRNTYHSLVVALQRGDDFISLGRQPEFEAGDILWIVGEPDQIDRIVKG
ncbi:MAG: cation:proton antiporter, partial [Muribaculaceae bacterium]|nr:cation:proton antiporter [Muribaculaceae bacterium]